MFRIIFIFAIWIGWFGHHPIRGKSTAPSIIPMVDSIKSVDNMPRKKTLDEVKTTFKKVWGDRYIYDHITEENYVNMNTKVPVECNEHGLFLITPAHHISGVGCRHCQYKKLREILLYENRDRVYGVGVFDVCYSCNANDTTKKASNTWRRMLCRCYSKDYLQRRPSYVNCSVCDEWLYFSNFKKWFDENYIENYSLDKDILVKGNKVYSPNTCCFVPQRINSLIVNHKRGRGKYPVGVRKGFGENKYTALYRKEGKTVIVGTFCCVEDAFNAYKSAKESYIKDIATQYFNDGKITKKVYNALMNYKVEITD